MVPAGLSPSEQGALCPLRFRARAGVYAYALCRRYYHRGAVTVYVGGHSHHHALSGDRDRALFLSIGTSDGGDGDGGGDGDDDVLTVLSSRTLLDPCLCGSFPSSPSFPGFLRGTVQSLPASLLPAEELCMGCSGGAWNESFACWRRVSRMQRQ